MATRSALLAVLILALPPARAAAAPEPSAAASTSERAGEGSAAPASVEADVTPAPAAPPAALLVPAGPAYPIGPAPAEAAPSGHPAAVEIAPPRITDVAEVPAAPAAPETPEALEAPTALEAAAAPAAPLTASQRETLRFQMRSYLRQVYERVGAAWAAPLAAGRGARREALVTVVIARDGRVVETRVDRSSRDEGFDRSALRVLARPHLFPPLPPYYQTDSLEVGLRFADPARARR